MAYQFSGPQFLGVPGINTGGTTPGFTATYTTLPDGASLGMEVAGIDPVTGYTGRFKLLFGVASTVVGSLVSYDAATGLTTLSPATATATTYGGLPFAVAMSANVGPTVYGWYQITGPATIKKTAVTVSPGVKIFLSGTAGRIKVLTSAGLLILGARTANTTTVTSTTSTVLVTIGAGGMVNGGTA